MHSKGVMYRAKNEKTLKKNQKKNQKPIEAPKTRENPTSNRYSSIRGLGSKKRANTRGYCDGGNQSNRYQGSKI